MLWDIKSKVDLKVMLVVYDPRFAKIIFKSEFNELVALAIPKLPQQIGIPRGTHRITLHTLRFQ